MDFPAQFRDDLPCLFCGNRDHVVLTSLDDHDVRVGVCEACSVLAHWKWRDLPGTAPPVEHVLRPRIVFVLVPRLRELGGDLGAPPDAAASYEFALVPAPGDGLALPNALVGEHGDEQAAAFAALAAAGIATWPACLEPLCTCYAARGTLVRVFLATAHYRVGQGDLARRPWPLVAGELANDAIYETIDAVWALRVWKHLAAPEPKPVAAGLEVRRAAVEYIRTQGELRAGRRDVDTSMLEYLRRAMTDDERALDRVLTGLAARADEAERQELVAEGVEGVDARDAGGEGEDFTEDLPAAEDGDDPKF